MSNNRILQIKDGTIFTALTSEQLYLGVEVNGKSAGIPLYSFIDADPILQFSNINYEISLDINGVYANATPYNAGVVFTVNCSAYALPLYNINGLSAENVANRFCPINPPSYLEFNNAQIANSLTATNTYVAINVNGDGYGIPLYEFSSLTQTGAVTSTASDFEVTTNMGKKVQDVVTGELPSTYANSKIHAYSDLIKRLKMNLGYPFVEVELCDEQWAEYIDQACEFYTQYAGYTEEMIAFDSDSYPAGKGLYIPDVFEEIATFQETAPEICQDYMKNEFKDPATGKYRKCHGVYSLDQAGKHGLDSLFTLEYMYAAQAYYTAALGGFGTDMVTWETLSHYLDTREKVFATTPRYRFDIRTQRLRITPEPTINARYIGVVGLYLERPSTDIIKERWVQQYAIAISKIAIGNIRTKFGTVTLFGGGQINGSDLLSQGLAEKEKLETEILRTYIDVDPPQFFIG